MEPLVPLCGKSSQIIRNSSPKTGLRSQRGQGRLHRFLHSTTAVSTVVIRTYSYAVSYAHSGGVQRFLEPPPLLSQNTMSVSIPTTNRNGLYKCGTEWTYSLGGNVRTALVPGFSTRYHSGREYSQRSTIDATNQTELLCSGQRGKLQPAF